jgi:hypothetical protein
MRVSDLRLTVNSSRLGHKDKQRGGHNCILAVSFDQFASTGCVRLICRIVKRPRSGIQAGLGVT